MNCQKATHGGYVCNLEVGHTDLCQHIDVHAVVVEDGEISYTFCGTVRTGSDLDVEVSDEPTCAICTKRKAEWDAAHDTNGTCERCGDKDVQLQDHWIPATHSSPSEPEYLCSRCYQQVRTGTGAYDPDNRDWDAVRDEQDGY